MAVGGHHREHGNHNLTELGRETLVRVGETDYADFPRKVCNLNVTDGTAISNEPRSEPTKTYGMKTGVIRHSANLVSFGYGFYFSISTLVRPQAVTAFPTIQHPITEVPTRNVKGEADTVFSVVAHFTNTADSNDLELIIANRGGEILAAISIFRADTTVFSNGDKPFPKAHTKVHSLAVAI